jgi:deoxyribose-phosphate aldolase
LNIDQIIAAVDHTLLAPTATWAQIKDLCTEAMEYGTASVCIPPCHVRDAASFVNGRIPVCTVIGFPNGYSAGSVKLFEAKTAVSDGASEIDMVINLGWVKERRYGKVFSEINAIKALIGEEHILKVIVETCALTEEEKIRICEVVDQSGADFIKTSTGFGSHGATAADVALFRRCSRNLKIKASGGISTLGEAWNFLSLGASRLGTSKIVPLLREQEIAGKNAVSHETAVVV